jgi:hypothetical protein
MLLLGAGESGKVRRWSPYSDRRGLNTFPSSRLLKQVKLIHHGGYNDSERDSCKKILFSNTTQCMRSVLLCPYISLYPDNTLPLAPFSRQCPNSTSPSLPKKTPAVPPSSPFLPKSRLTSSHAMSAMLSAHDGGDPSCRKPCVARASSSSMTPQCTTSTPSTACR